MATAPKLVEPPVQNAPLDTTTSSTQFSQAWTEYNQSVADQINQLISTAAVSGTGVIDGSDAAAGKVGEYLTATGSAALSNNAVVTVATLTLTAGDWQVTGGVVFHIAGAASNHYAAAIDGVGNEIIATIPSGTGTWQLQAGTVRRNVTASTAVNLSAVAGFTSGSVSADGTISARRMR